MPITFVTKFVEIDKGQRMLALHGTQRYTDVSRRRITQRVLLTLATTTAKEAVAMV